MLKYSHHKLFLGYEHKVYEKNKIFNRSECSGSVTHLPLKSDVVCDRVRF